MRYTVMAKNSEELKRIGQRMKDEKGDYYDSSKKYLNSIMSAMNQDDLMESLQDLDIDELKQCISAGVPGDACAEANRLLKELKAEIQAYLVKKGAEAHAKTAVETPEN